MSAKQTYTLTLISGDQSSEYMVFVEVPCVCVRVYWMRLSMRPTSVCARVFVSSYKALWQTWWCFNVDSSTVPVCIDDFVLFMGFLLSFFAPSMCAAFCIHGAP